MGFCPLFLLWDFVLWDFVLWDFVRRDFVLWDFVLWDSVPDSRHSGDIGQSLCLLIKYANWLDYANCPKYAN